MNTTTENEKELYRSIGKLEESTEELQEEQENKKDSSKGFEKIFILLGRILNKYL